MKKILFLLLISTHLLAFPKKLEVWFLSVDKRAFLETILKPITYSSKIATNYQCQPMGDYCFDPQIGLYKKEKDQIIQAVDYSSLDSKEKFDKNGKYKEGIYSPCTNKNHFNIFCGTAKSKKVKKSLSKQKLEFWVDISTTMKQVDFKSYDNACYRETFLKRIGESCPLNDKMKVFIFDENRKELGNFDRVCLNSGLNRIDRLMRDIKASTAQSLIIITDIYEAKANFIDFVEGEGVGIVRGIDKPLYARSILKDVDRMKSICK